MNTLGESIRVQQADIKDISTYICINEDIRRLLVSDRVQELNRNAKLWQEGAPIELLQDMISLKGHIRTIAIYPENGLRPYLRGMDGSVYLPDMETVRDTDTYKKTLESGSGILWMREEKGKNRVYANNKTDKVVLCREIFDLTQTKRLGYLVIGVQQEYFQELCDNIVRDEAESVLVLDPNGEILSQAGEMEPAVEEYLLSESFLKQENKGCVQRINYRGYDIFCCQTEQNASIVCKAVPQYGLRMFAADNIFSSVILLFGMLIGLLPLLSVISNSVSRPLQKVSHAMNKFSEGDFGQQVEVATNDEVGEVARCFNKMVKDIKRLIDENYVITLRERENLSLAEVSEHIGISKSYLSTMFTQNLGAGFVDYLNQVRIERACLYLEQHTLKNYEIAYKVGFRDEKYFAKVFKKLKGLSPKEYRAMH